jgi:hypothetical protein
MKSKDKDPLLLFFEVIKKVKDNERLLIIVIFGFTELLFNLIIDEKCKHEKK